MIGPLITDAHCTETDGGNMDTSFGSKLAIATELGGRGRGSLEETHDDVSVSVRGAMDQGERLLSICSGSHPLYMFS